MSSGEPSKFSILKAPKPLTELLRICATSASECKELQLSEDQSPAVKAARGFAAAHDHPRHFRGKGVRMKSKARAAPYPEVGLGPALLIASCCYSK